MRIQFELNAGNDKKCEKRASGGTHLKEFLHDSALTGVLQTSNHLSKRHHFSFLHQTLFRC